MNAIFFFQLRIEFEALKITGATFITTSIIAYFISHPQFNIQYIMKYDIFHISFEDTTYVNQFHS